MLNALYVVFSIIARRNRPACFALIAKSFEFFRAVSHSWNDHASDRCDQRWVTFKTILRFRFRLAVDSVHAENAPATCCR